MSWWYPTISILNSHKKNYTISTAQCNNQMNWWWWQWGDRRSLITERGKRRGSSPSDMYQPSNLASQAKRACKSIWIWMHRVMVRAWVWVWIWIPRLQVPLIWWLPLEQRMPQVPLRWWLQEQLEWPGNYLSQPSYTIYDIDGTKSKRKTWETWHG